MASELAALYGRLYLDPDVPVQLAGMLRAQGVDVLTTLEAGALGRDDPDQLAAAVAADRAMVTHNRVDFRAASRRVSSGGADAPGHHHRRPAPPPGRDPRSHRGPTEPFRPRPAPQWALLRLNLPELSLVRVDERSWRRGQVWRINLMINVFPVFQNTGTGVSGQALDTSVGDVY